MRKWIFAFVILIFIFFLADCGGKISGQWGVDNLQWGYEGPVSPGVKVPIKGFSGFIIALEKCQLEVNGKNFNLPPLHGIPVTPGEVIKFPSGKCKFRAFRDVIFQGEGGREGRSYAILPEGVFLFGVKYENTYRFFPLVYGGKFALPQGEFAFLKVYTKEEWKKLERRFSRISYIEVGDTSYQVLHLFPGEERKFPTKKKERLLFSTIVLSMLPPAGEYFPAPGVRFAIRAVGKDRQENIWEFQQRTGVKEHDLEIPSWAEELEFYTEGRDLGNLSFITNPYFYSPSRNAPIVVLISMDTVRAKSLELYGGRAAPFLTEFAKEARVYERAYTPHPWTYDGHMAVFFSRYSWEPQKFSFVEALQRKGYFTAAFTGGGLVAPHLGFARGFLLYHFRPLDIFDVSSSRRLYQSAKEFLLKNHDKPIFLFLHTYQAHSPYMANGETFDVVSRVGGLSGIFSPLDEQQRLKAEELYEKEINRIDSDFLKPFVSFLKKEKLISRTHMIIFADHGEQFFEHGNWEHGYSLYEEEVHVPLIVKSKKFKPGRDKSLISLVNLWEIVSTITRIKKEEPWKERKGIVVLSTPISDGGFHFPKVSGIIKGKMKLIRNISIDKRFFKNYPQRQKLELYNLITDKNEQHNIYGTVKEGISLQRLLRPFIDFYLQGKGYKPTRRDLEKLRSLGYVE